MARAYQARPIDVGRQRWRELKIRFGRELKTARLGNGLTQTALAHRAGISQEFVSAIERAARQPSWEVACRLGAAAGCELNLRLYPAEGVSLRDSGQLALARQITATAHAAWRIRLEEPVGDHTRRAHDMVLDLAEEVVAIEIERGVFDFQAQLRAAQLKRQVLSERSERFVRLIIAIPDTAANRRIVREQAALLSRTMPVASRAIWQAIRGGTPVGGDGIVFVPRPPKRASDRPPG